MKKKNYLLLGTLILSSLPFNIHAYSDSDRMSRSGEDISPTYMEIYMTDEDRDLKNKIEERLRNDWYTSPNIDKVTVLVRNRDVILQGTVPTQFDKDSIGDSAKRVSGIRNFENQLSVSHN